jgi:two-component system nitrate/nitrite response regulator NarL
MEAPISILIVGRERLTAECLQQALQCLDSRFEVVGVATTGVEGAHLAARQSPHVVLVDSELAQEITVSFVRAIGRNAAIVMLGNDDAEQTLLNTIDVEWRGYVDKSLSIDSLAAVVRQAAAGEVAMPADLLYRAIKRQTLHMRKGDSPGLNHLTAREREVLDLIGHGLDNKSIAAALGIRLNTTRSHVQRVLEKLGVNSKLQAMKYAGGRGSSATPNPHRSSRRHRSSKR